MFESALKAAYKLSSEINPSKDKGLTLSPECLPKRYTLEQLYDEVVRDDEAQRTVDELSKLLVVGCCLSDIAQLHKVSTKEEIDVNKLAIWISKVMLPSSNLILHDEMPEAPKSDSRQLAILNARSRGDAGMRALMFVFEMVPRAITNFPKTMISILAFTSSLDPWTTSTSLTLAKSLINVPIMSECIRSEGFILNEVIQNFIYELFSKSKPEGITASGRKAMPSSAPRKVFDVNKLEKASRPWKYDVPHAVTVFGWVIENMSPVIITENFYRFVPPLLTLLDEVSTPIRQRALTILPTFFSALNPELLSQTGLGSVFEDALLPVLLYLPTFTPVEESLRLLPDAYNALFTLCSVRYVSTSSKSEQGTSIAASNPHKKTHSDISSVSRLAFLDRLMRQGIIPGYFHASNHWAIVQVLFEQLTILIPLLGIYVSKHLPHVLSIITITLNDPFCVLFPKTLLAAITALKLLLLNTWPRVSDQRHRMEIVKALVLCWVTLMQEHPTRKSDREDMEEVRESLNVTGRILVQTVEAVEGGDLESELTALIKARPSLRELFGFDTSI